MCRCKYADFNLIALLRKADAFQISYPLLLTTMYGCHNNTKVLHWSLKYFKYADLYLPMIKMMEYLNLYNLLKEERN